jgi:hypothetical protein
MRFFDPAQRMKRSKPKPVSQEEQSRRFIEAAQGLDTDATLKQIVRKKAKFPPKQTAKTPKKW